MAFWQCGYQYTIHADNIQDLAHWGPILLANMKKLSGFQDVNTDQQNSGLQELLNYDRTTAARLGQTSQSLDQSLYNAFGQAEVSVIYTHLNQYYVVLEVAPKYWQDPSGLNRLYFHSGGSSNSSETSSSSSRAELTSVTPLHGVMTSQTSTTPLQVNHTGLFPSVTVSFNLAKGVALGTGTQEIEEMEARLGMPASVQGTFAGTAEAFKQSLATEPLFLF